MSKKKGYAKGGAGFAKPHNYFAGGSVTNNLNLSKDCSHVRPHHCPLGDYSV